MSPAETGEQTRDPLVAELRAEISAVDGELVAALNRRLEIVGRLHEHKRAHGMPLRDPEREAALLAELQARNGGPLSERGLADFVDYLLALTRRELHGG